MVQNKTMMGRLLSASILATILVGAAAPGDSLSAPQPTQDATESSARDIARQGTATVEDAYRAFLSLAASQGRVKLDQDADDLSFDEVTAQLVALCLIDPDWSYSPDTCLRRDVMAYMACSYLGCRPGLLTGALGMTRRYAHREMLYQKVIPPGAPATLVSGSELLSVASRVSRRYAPRRDVQLKDNQIH